jgi:ribonuclease P protein component
VQGQGWRIQSEHLLLLVLHVPGSATRVGFTVSKKVGGAVERNRVRRLLREGVRRHKAILAGEAWLVVVAKPHAATITFAQVDREIMDMGRRIRGARGRRGADRPGSGSGSRDVC